MIQMNDPQSIGRIKSGYVWQYLINENIRSTEGKPILCTLRKEGDFIGVAKHLLKLNAERYLIGSCGAEIEWDVDPEEVNSDSLSKESLISLRHTQVTNNYFNEIESRCYDLDDLAYINDLRIISDIPETHLEESSIIRLWDSDYYLQLPLYRPRAGLQTVNAIKTIEPSILHRNSTSTSLQSLVRYLLEVVGIKHNFAYLLDKLTELSINENQEGLAEDLITFINDLGAPVYEEDGQQIGTKINTSGDDFIIHFSDNKLIYCGYRREWSFEKYTNNRVLRVGLTVPKQLSFVTYFQEIASNGLTLFIILISSFIIQLLTLSVPLLFQQIIDKVISQQNPGLLPVFLTIMVCSVLLGGLIRSGRQILLFEVADKADEKFSQYVLRRLINIDFSYFDGSKKGDIASRLSEVSNVRSFFTGPALSTVLDVLFSVVYLSVLLLYSIQLTIAALLPLPIYMGVVIWGAPLYKKLLRTRSNKRSILISYLLEVVSGIQSVKLQNYETEAVKNWKTKYTDQQKVSLNLTVFGSILGELSTFSTQLISIIVLGYGTVLVLSGSLTVGELIAFRIICGFLTTPLVRISSLWQSVQETQVSLDRVNSILKAKDDRGGTLKLRSENSSPTIQFTDVIFAYRKNSDNVLSNINFSISDERRVALVGPSGSGKSTIIKLISGLYSQKSGDILINNKAKEFYSSSAIRSSIYCIPQESHFIGGTLEDNIRYGFLDCTEEDIMNALELASLKEIAETKKGLQFMIDEGGANLSGGQKQRLAIARMILRKPKFLMLDEATSALDASTENRVFNNIFTTLADSTVLYITHRILSSKNADKIILLDNGTVQGIGNYDELIRSSLLFKELVKNAEQV